MATKPRSFNPDLYYHTYNCGVEKRIIFSNSRDYERFLGTIAYYTYDQKLSYAQLQDLPPFARQNYLLKYPPDETRKRVKILAYCPMPNHFHFLLKPTRPNGIIQFISDISNSHAKYFNIKNKRLGKLFQGAFKSKEIDNEASLLQLSRYIHINPSVSSKTKGKFLKPEDYPYSSYREWLNPEKTYLVDKEELAFWLKTAGGPKEYQSFVEAKFKEEFPLEDPSGLELE